MRQLLWLVVTASVLVTIWLTIQYWNWLSGSVWEWLSTAPGGESGGETNSATLRNVGLLIAGFVALLIAGWRSWVAGRQADTAEQDLLNDRYQVGAEMLGNDVLAVRLGGIYALQRLAEEHPKQYHVQIMRLFCAFVRHPTKGSSLRIEPKADESHSPGFEDEERVILGSLLREDVKAVMEAICVRKCTSIALERAAQFRLNLAHADLAGMGMIPLEADLSRTSLLEANLSSAWFLDTNLSGEDLLRANLSDANLSGANLSGTYLHGVTNLTQMRLDEARADPMNPPRIGGTLDAETGEPLVWRGKQLNDEA